MIPLKSKRMALALVGLIAAVLSSSTPILAQSPVQQTGPNPWPVAAGESHFVCNIGFTNVDADGTIELGSRPSQGILTSLPTSQTDSVVEVVCVGTDASGDAGVVGRYPLGMIGTYSNGIPGREASHRAWSVSNHTAWQGATANWLSPSVRLSPWHMMPPIASDLQPVPLTEYTPNTNGYLYSFRYSGAVSLFESADFSTTCASYASAGITVNPATLGVADEVLECDTLDTDFTQTKALHDSAWYVYMGLDDGGAAQTEVPITINAVYQNLLPGEVPIPPQRPYHWPTGYDPLETPVTPPSNDTCTPVSYRIYDGTGDLVSPSVPYALSQRSLAPQPDFLPGNTYTIEVTVSTSGADGGLINATVSGTQDGISQREFTSGPGNEILNFSTDFAGGGMHSLTMTCAPANAIGTTVVLTHSDDDEPVDPGEFGGTGLPVLVTSDAPISGCWAGLSGFDFLNPASYGSTFSCAMLWLFVPTDGVFTEALLNLTNFSQSKVPFSWGVDLFSALVNSTGAFSGNASCGLDISITGGTADQALNDAWCSSPSTSATFGFIRTLFVYGIWIAAARRIWAAAPFNDGKETV